MLVSVFMMFGGGRGMRGGREGGGSMLRSVGRAVTCSVYGTETNIVSSSNFASAFSRKLKSSKNTVSLLPSGTLSSSHNNNNLFPFWHSSPDTDDDYEWVYVDHLHGIQDDVPSEIEVQDALSALHQVFGPASSSQLVRDKFFCKLDNELDHVTVPGLLDQVSLDGSETDWEEPSFYPHNSKMLQVNGFDRVYYAFHLLQTQPYVQRMVKSLSSDKAVWDAVLNNEVVRELRESISADEYHVFQSPDETSNSDSCTTTNVVMWLIDTAKAKFMEVIEKITKIVNELFQPADHKTDADAECPDTFEDNVRTSFMLSIMVLLIVVVNRAQAKPSCICA